MQKCSMWKPETKNKTLPTRQPLLGGQQKEIQYPGWNMDTTGKRLWSEQDNEVPWGDRVVWGYIEMIEGWQDK